MTSHMTEAFENHPTAARLFAGPTGQQRLRRLLDHAASAYENPRYCYFPEIIRENAERLSQCFPQATRLYSVKANPNPDIIRTLLSVGCGLEIASGGELPLGLNCGARPDQIHFTTPGRSQSEIEQALPMGLAMFNLDSENEAATVGKLYPSTPPPTPIGFRVNLVHTTVRGIEVMAGGSSRFGLDDDRLMDLFKTGNPWPFPITGLHMYSSSQVLNAEQIAGHIARALTFARQFRDRTGQPLAVVNVGGGFGVPNHSSEGTLDWEALREAVREPIEAAVESGLRIMVESGRFLVAESGLYLARVVDLKCSQGQNYAILDGGMNHFLRPVLMNVAHPMVVLNRADEPATTVYDVTGRLCTPIDTLGRSVRLPRLEIGDFIAFLNAGAYGKSMSVQAFLSHPPAEEVML